MARDLIDRTALLRHRARAKAAPVTVLHEIAATEISERLTDINRSFTSIAIVTGEPSVWKRYWPDAKIVQDSETLSLNHGAHDLIIHGLALHWANDSVGQIIQCRRALKPDGLFLSAQFGGRSLHELRSALAEAEIALCGGLSPRVLPMAELRDLGQLLIRAGLALPVADSNVLHLSYGSFPELLQDLRQMGETNALADRRRTFTRRHLFAKAAAFYQANFTDAEHRLNATVEMIFLTGWAPDPSQQKPLRRGSAMARLADALGTTEFDLGDAAGYPTNSKKTSPSDES